MRINRKITRFAVCATAAVAVLGVQAGAASAKTVKFTMTVKGKPNGPLDNIASTLSSPQLGKGKQSGYVKLPVSFYTWKFTSGKYKGSSLKATGQGTLEGSKVTKGTWKMTKGTGKGKFKGATGSGKASGDIATGLFKFTGTLKLK